MGRMAVVLATLLVTTISVCHAFYIPGMLPSEFSDGAALEIKALSMTSAKTQLPYEYYSLSFCGLENPEEIHYKKLNLGEVLRGDRIVNTLYKFKMMKEVVCLEVCSKTLTEQESNQFVDRIEQDYTVHLILDNLPAATVFKNLKTNELQYEDGFKLGFVFEKQAYLNNHLYITVRYHPVDSKGSLAYRIVGFEVEPQSFAEDAMTVVSKEGGVKECGLAKEGETKQRPLAIKRGSKNNVRFTFSVQFKESDIAWASRWDTYLHMSDVQIHWFAICNSVAIVLFLTGILALILIRTLRRDIARYNMKDEELDDVLEETGWKLVHGDVFRPPAHPMLLVACLGSGIQLFSMVIIILGFAMFGMLSPASRGALMSAAIVLFMFMGLFAGYHSARLFRTLKGSSWKNAAALTATLYPGTVFGLGFLLNFFIWGKHSSGAVPFTTMLALLFLWFGISFPLIFCGFFFGYRKQAYEHPVRTNQIPRQIPEQPWYLNPILKSIVAGILPFGAIFVELFFILSAIWENQFYYLFGFLYLVFAILGIACAEVSIAMAYFQLCAENYHWWWQSFFISGSPSYYVLVYSVVYYITKLEIEDFIPTMLYFGYTFLAVLGFWLLTGTIGFYATYLFIRKIYAAVKQD